MTMPISFEVFPPKTEAGLDTLADTVRQLDRVDPAFVSVTYGAGGSSRERSFDAIDAVRRSTDAPVAAHLTCVGQSRRQVEEVIDHYERLGVDRIVALRGDPPGGMDGAYEPHPDGFTSTDQLVATIKARSDATVAVSAYPERHPQSPTFDHDLDVLESKVRAGADAAITQMFFDNEHYRRYIDRMTDRGIDVPVVPGVFPIHSIDTVTRIATSCGATLPGSISGRLARAEDLDEARSIAADIAAEQVRGLAELGAPGVHLYTVNRPELALAVCDRLELAPT